MNSVSVRLPSPSASASTQMCDSSCGWRPDFSRSWQPASGPTKPVLLSRPWKMATWHASSSAVGDQGRSACNGAPAGPETELSAEPGTWHGLPGSHIAWILAFTLSMCPPASMSRLASPTTAGFSSTVCGSCRGLGGGGGGGKELRSSTGTDHGNVRPCRRRFTSARAQMNSGIASRPSESKSASRQMRESSSGSSPERSRISFAFQVEAQPVASASASSKKILRYLSISSSPSSQDSPLNGS
mmetsp:Transcript_55075/g.118983  ORF Transcript_55075/g.118983 Transcript_55075/m.118983 type:complete len:243 (-) Transcript_55075:285-1013(-)